MNTIGYDPIAEIGLGFSNILQVEDIAPGSAVLNWGCGFGDPTFVIRRCIGDSGRAIGIDYSAHNISLARQNCGNFGYSNVTFFPYQSVIKKSDSAAETAYQQTVFDDATFDTAVCSLLLNLVPTKATALREIYRLLKPGGKLLLTDFFASQPVSSAATERITQKYLQQTHQDYSDIIANSTIELLGNAKSNTLLQFEAYSDLLKQIGFNKINIKCQSQIEVNSGELLMYMEHNDLEAFSKADCMFNKTSLLIEK